MSDTMRTRLVQMEVHPGCPERNLSVILDQMHEAERDGITLLVCPEMAIPGYLIGDEWERESFLRECEACAHEIRQASRSVATVFGSVAMDWNKRNEDGRVRKYNALFVAYEGRFVRPNHVPLDFVVKALHPNYRQFDDSRHFFGLRTLAAELGVAPADLVQPVTVGSWRLGGVLCEDAWHEDYGFSPLAVLKERGIDVAVNISASPYTFDKRRKRHRVFTAHARQLGVPLVFVNAVGIQNNGKTVFVFDGSSCVYDAQGKASVPAPSFEPAVQTFELAAGPQAQDWARCPEPASDTIADLWGAIESGTRRFLALCGVGNVVVGISGGIDSAVAAAVYARLVPPDSLTLVTMPGPYTSGTTRTLAARLADALGCLYTDVPIKPSVDLTVDQLQGLSLASRCGGVSGGHLELSSFVIENIQARDRSARLLAAVAAALGGVFTCNANKSEMTVGYSTLYGDLAGFFANLADLWKGEVYALARYLNDHVYGREIIPQGTLDLPPSAELNAGQNVDEGRGDPLRYAYHDCLFASWTECWNRATPEDIVRWYLDGDLEARLGYEGRVADFFSEPAEFVADLEYWWARYQGIGLVKRIQAPPVLALKRRAFGFDHREALMGPHYTRDYQALKQACLNGLGHSKV